MSALLRHEDVRRGRNSAMKCGIRCVADHLVEQGITSCSLLVVESEKKHQPPLYMLRTCSTDEDKVSG